MGRRRCHMHSSDSRVWYFECCPSQSCCIKGSTKDRKIAADSSIASPNSRAVVVRVPVRWLADHSTHLIPVYQTGLVTRLDPSISLHDHSYTVCGSALTYCSEVSEILNHLKNNICLCKATFASVTYVGLLAMRCNF